GMFIEACTSFCGARNLAYAGVEYARECCSGAPANARECSMPCAGDAAQVCGGGNRLQVYMYYRPPRASTASSVGDAERWTFVGCYKLVDLCARFRDGATARTLPNGTHIAGGMSAEKCTSTCQAMGLLLAGTDLGAALQAGDCDMPCTGNSSQLCGGGNRLTVFRDQPPEPQPTPPPPPPHLRRDLRRL
ncbi:hypothetical protein DFH09DRAFT_899896, partial [Mycena vulgaris]